MTAATSLDSSKLQLDFVELEFKYLINDDFDEESFRNVVMKLEPAKHFTTKSSDTYFSSPKIDGVFRFRHDEELQELTFKKSSKDAWLRTEINLELDTSKNQSEAVKHFLQIALGTEPTVVTISKTVEVFLFSDVEIVLYHAHRGEKYIRCVEIEAKNPQSEGGAMQILENYERTLGFFPNQRSSSSTFELLSS